MKTQPLTSPRWNNTTKLIIGLTFVLISAGFLISFRTFVVPLMLAFLMAYLLYPVVDKLRLWIKIPWRVLVTIIYLFCILALIGLLIWGGVAIVEQLQSLVRFSDRVVNTVSGAIFQLSVRTYQVGPFLIDLRETDFNYLANQVLGVVEPMISSAGTLVGSLASTTAATIGLMLFVLVFSYFILAETEGIPGRLFNLKIPGYYEDLQRMGRELGRTWNAFLRGQLILFAVAFIIYNVTFGALGVRFSFFMAIIAGLARMIPYVGPVAAWVTFSLVAYSQSYHPFGLSPEGYMFLVLGVSLLTDSVLDNVIAPRVMGDALHVHPAAVMVAILAAVGLVGPIGVLVAAPVLASLQLIVTYAVRKMFDMDPWSGLRMTPSPPPLRLFPIGNPFKQTGQRIQPIIQKKDTESSAPQEHDHIDE